MTQITPMTNKKTGKEFDLVKDLKTKRGEDISSNRRTVFADSLNTVEGRFPEVVVLGDDGIVGCNSNLYGIKAGNLWTKGIKDSRAVGKSELYSGPVKESHVEAGERMEVESVSNRGYHNGGSELELKAVFDETERDRIEKLRQEGMRELTHLGQGLIRDLRNIGYTLDNPSLLRALRPENHEELLKRIKRSQVGGAKASDIRVKLSEYGQLYQDLKLYTDYIANDRFGSGIHVHGPISKGTTFRIGGKEHKINEDRPKREGEVFSLRINRGVLTESYVPESGMSLDQKVRSSYKHSTN
jgi:hypothetical protein